jgi:hypothetical protein
MEAMRTSRVNREAAAEDLMQISVEQMKRLGYSKNRIRVALQNGGLKRAFDRVDNESTAERQGAMLIAIRDCICAIGTIDESKINEICNKWDKED